MDNLFNKTVILTDLHFGRDSNNPINFEKDKRFKTRPWLQYTYKNMVNNITKDIVIDIIRWLIMLRKMIAFT